MDFYKRSVEIRWADLDANFHLRHSVYYDYGANCRIHFMQENGLTIARMQELHFGPILFREEAIFRKEIILEDRLQIDLKLLRARRDFSRWSIRHELLKNETILAATINVEGAWINTMERKLATPPAAFAQVFGMMPKSDEFQWHTP